MILGADWRSVIPTACRIRFAWRRSNANNALDQPLQHPLKKRTSGRRVENTIDMAIEAEKRKWNLLILQHRQLDPVANSFGQTKPDSLPLHTPASRTFLATVSDHKS